MLDDSVNSIEEDFYTELAHIQAESIGWIPLDEGAYLHVGWGTPVIQVVGVAKEEMAGSMCFGWPEVETLPPSQTLKTANRLSETLCNPNQWHLI